MINNPRKENKIENKTFHLKSLNTKKDIDNGDWYKIADAECDRFYI
jgi:hypothetical protein